MVLQAGDSALPRHRQARVAVSRRPCTPAPPPGLTDPSRTAGIGPKISTFCSKVNSTFCMRACAWPRLPTTPQARSAQPTGSTPELLMQHTRPAPNNSASPRRREASPTDSPPWLLTCSRKNMVCQKRPMAHAPSRNESHRPRRPVLLVRVRAWERIDAALPPRRNTHLRAAALLQRSAPASPQRFVL